MRSLAAWPSTRGEDRALPETWISSPNGPSRNGSSPSPNRWGTKPCREGEDIRTLLDVPGVDREAVRDYFERHGLLELYDAIEKSRRTSR